MEYDEIKPILPSNITAQIETINSINDTNDRLINTIEEINKQNSKSSKISLFIAFIALLVSIFSLFSTLKEDEQLDILKQQLIMQEQQLEIYKTLQTQSQDFLDKYPYEQIQITSKSDSLLSTTKINDTIFSK